MFRGHGVAVSLRKMTASLEVKQPGLLKGGTDVVGLGCVFEVIQQQCQVGNNRGPPWFDVGFYLLPTNIFSDAES